MVSFGSVNNYMMAHSTNGAPAPEVGMGATMLMWSDRHPYTVIEVSKSGKRCKVQADDILKWKNHYAETIVPNTQGPVYELSIRKNGQWKQVGGTQVFAIGYRSGYNDPHF